MKTKLFLLLPALLIGVLVFSFCGGSKSNNEKNTSPDSTTTVLDTLLDKYCGQYVYMNHYYLSVGKFPANTKLHPNNTPTYFQLDKKYVGKYFISEDRFVWETSKVFNPVGGYIGPPTGNIILGVDGNGTMTIQNYLTFIKPDGTMDMGLGGTGPGAKFILRSDGKYEIDINNGQYICMQKL